jgi:hypothetical protein
MNIKINEERRAVKKAFGENMLSLREGRRKREGMDRWANKWMGGWKDITM